MSEPVDNLPESSIPLFDVVINMPSSARLEDIERRARDVAGISPDKIARLMHVLRSSPQAKIGAGVTREKADQAQDQFSKAGLTVTITPLLTIQTALQGSLDGTFVCPACKKRGVLSEHRQCPSCGVFVDKVTDEVLLRRKLLEQERGRIEFSKAKSAMESSKREREMLEASIRAKIRAELEEEYGIQQEKLGIFSGSARVFKAAGMLALLVVAFMGGRGFSTEGIPFIGTSAKAPAGTAAPMTAQSLGEISKGEPGAGGSSTVGTGTADTPGLATGDPDVDDPLIQAAGGKRIGAKGMTLEQAVAAAQVLGKSVGNTTAERALAGGSASGVTGADGSAATGATSPTAQTQTEDTTTSQAGSTTGATAPGVSKQIRLTLTAEFAQALAELGQSARASGVLKAAMASVDASTDPAAVNALRNAEINMFAWAVQRREVGSLVRASEDLKTKILAVAEPAERTRLLGQTAVILSRGGQLPPEMPRAFLSLAAESLRLVTATNQSNAALGNLAVSMAEVFAIETTNRAKAGSWSKAQSSAAQIEGLIKQAPDAWTQLRLYAVDHQIQLHLGQSDKARQSLEAALAQVSKSSNLAERAVWLRSIAQLGDAASQEQFEKVMVSLQAQVEVKSGMEKAEALSQLALLYAHAGLPARAEQYRKRVHATPGLSQAESTAVSTDLIVRSDLAMARVLQELGRYAEVESLLQRVGGFLL